MSSYRVIRFLYKIEKKIIYGGSTFIVKIYFLMKLKSQKYEKVRLKIEATAR
jgi:hypothetical protein